MRGKEKSGPVPSGPMTETDARKLRLDMNSRTLELQDGERKDRWRLDHIKKASQRYGRPWIIVFDDAADRIAAARMGPTSARLLQWAMARLDPRAWHLVEQYALAEILGVDRSSISRAINDLCRRGILCRQGRLYRLSLWLCWRGTAAAYRKEIKTSRRFEIEHARAWHDENARQPAADIAAFAATPAEPHHKG